jgi:GDP-D-mannose 3',5'-epimerase
MNAICQREKKKVCLVTGSSGFIGGHLVKRLKDDGYFVIGADIVQPKYEEPHRFYHYDLRVQNLCKHIFIGNKFTERYQHIDEVYNLACLMGGMGYIGNPEHSYDVMIGSSQIVSNIIECCVEFGVNKSFYSSSACAYNMHHQTGIDNVSLKESQAYPAMCDLTYGWQKLFSEQMYQAAAEAKGLNIRIARFHNIFGEYGIFDGGKEKFPAAICRKVAQATSEIEVWGDGKQTRSFLYVSECIEGIIRLMASDCTEPVNIGSDELISINDLAYMVMGLASKSLTIKNIDGPTGVRGRNSDNTLIQQKLGWAPNQRLIIGMGKLYNWINQQVNGNK